MFDIVWNSMLIIAAPIGDLLFYFGPVLLPIWRAIPQPIRLGIAAIIAACLAYLGGRYRGRQNAEEEERQRNADALQKRHEVNNEIAKLSPKEREDKLRDRWSRRDP
jgi:membrane protein implicated in regulation of membrane protease activity